MRIGADVGKYDSARAWALAHAEKGYGACVFPVKGDADASVIDEYAREANDAQLVIAEVGAWSNPLDPNPEKRRAAIDYNIRQLALAERVGARCCVNISGSCHKDIWMAPHPQNLTDDTFDEIVRNTREIIDAVRPTRAFYTLETMPWCYPDSLESYARLLEKVNRDAFAVHFDACNLTYTPHGFYDFENMVCRAAMMFGTRIKSVHVKDLHLKLQAGNVEITEVPLGTGEMNLDALFEAMRPIDCPMILEHLPDQAAYARAAAHAKGILSHLGIPLTV